MVTLTIDKRQVAVPEGTTILDAAKSVGIEIPTLCFLKDINEIGACRICMVEIEGETGLIPSCNNVVKEGMTVYTNSPKVREARRVNLRLLLSQHDTKCTKCTRNGNCKLQKLTTDYNLLGEHYVPTLNKVPEYFDAPVVRIENRCVKCLRCVQICEKVQSMNIWDILGTASHVNVGVKLAKNLAESTCTFCGQCITHCPVGALQERDDTGKVFDALADPKKTVVVQVAPAVRAAWGEYYGLDPEYATAERLVSGLKTMGFDYVFDTNFSADLTIMEEGSEFVERFTHKDQYAWPMFTSCCPGWVRFIKGQFPDYVKNLSTAKSPQGMFGAVAKSYFAEKIGVDPKDMVVVSIMPCTAKKAERAIPNLNDACGDPDVDIVLTTREIVRMFRGEQINPRLLEETPFDSPLGEGTGAAVIFGATGGVMDAALRSAYYLVTGENPPADAFSAVRGMEGWKEATFTVPGAGDVRVAVVSGLANTRKLMEAIDKGTVEYDFVEVMACPGGCAGGGGQPIHDGEEKAEYRGDALWKIDANKKVRFSHENSEVQKLYADYLEKPLSHRSHELLHTDHEEWDMPKPVNYGIYHLR
jgi:NADP-reducing hydrogenase subunit HndD